MQLAENQPCKCKLTSQSLVWFLVVRNDPSNCPKFCLGLQKFDEDGKKHYGDVDQKVSFCSCQLYLSKSEKVRVHFPTNARALEGTQHELNKKQQKQHSAAKCKWHRQCNKTPPGPLAELQVDIQSKEEGPEVRGQEEKLEKRLHEKDHNRPVAISAGNSSQSFNENLDTHWAAISCTALFNKYVQCSVRWGRKGWRQQSDKHPFNYMMDALRFAEKRRKLHTVHVLEVRVDEQFSRSKRGTCVGPRVHK